MKTPYDDIIDLPHHVSSVHPRMSMYSRAAQFAPFSALTGHEAALRETARLTDTEMQLTQGEEDILNRKLAFLLEYKGAKPVISITYFEPDAAKSGGAYRTVTGTMKKVHPLECILEMDDGLRIPLGTVKDISGECFCCENALK